ncbi:hypothetical protein Aab01nite_78340 [Paractinoplanes abujensis]|uniref:Uncharacterized protein n=1 Tax=Paractinoplanes abujensis TaxID=882441 RepID=A0A7W7G329_9ACTN|nr:RIP homotypic interaction motif-containing protein [Actinoplanes abujensis]MBB4692276.1 hypothetical protein [Actinoplanes abujensis]GID24244.1 hypothetical protein Aab01nite_78340 [Actinoplanes abujensis]
MRPDVRLTIYAIRTDGRTRIVLHRSLNGWGARLDEFWISALVSELNLVDVEPCLQNSPAWTELLLGLRVDVVEVGSEPRRLILKRCRKNGDVAAILGDVEESTTALLVVSAEHGDDNGVVRPAFSDLDLSRRDALTGNFLPVLRAAVEQLGLVRALQSRPEPASPREYTIGRRTVPRLSPAADATPGMILQRPGQALLAQIRFQDVRGAQVGHHNVQVNRFIVERRDRPLNFGQVLDDPKVREAMAALLAEPRNDVLRGRLIAALGHVSEADVRSDPLVLQAGYEGPGFWERLLAFDAQGLQVGDYNKQHNTFRYVVTGEPSAAALLHHNPRLAMVITDYLCPRKGRAGLGDVRQTIVEALNALPSDVGRALGTSFKSPGKSLLIARSDGVTVGENNRMKNSFEQRTRAGTATVRGLDRPVGDAPAHPMPDVPEIVVEPASPDTARHGNFGQVPGITPRHNPGTGIGGVGGIG